MSKVNLKQLSDTTIQLIDGDRGVNYPNKKDFSSEDFCLFLDSSNLTKNGFNFSTKVFISRKKDEVMGNGRLNRGDLVMNTRGTIGNMGHYTDSIHYENIRINSGMLIIRGGSDYDNRFLYGFFRSKLFYSQVENIMSGSVQNQLPVWIFNFVRVPELDISTQQRIAAILSSLDAKIELNNRINVELEAMAKTLYDYWFVQFEFPEKNGKPYKSSGGRMVWNAELKREIPETWESKKLKEIATIIMGQSPKSESYNTEKKGIPLINGAADYERRLLLPKVYTTAPTRLCQKDDMIFCIRATIGNLTFAENTFCLGRGVAGVRSKELFLTEQIYFRLLQEIERFKKQATGSIIVGITKDDLLDSFSAIPPSHISERFHLLLAPLFAKLRLINFENYQLSELRDWLLPMLMNGQVKVN